MYARLSCITGFNLPIMLSNWVSDVNGRVGKNVNDFSETHLRKLYHSSSLQAFMYGHQYTHVPHLCSTWTTVIKLVYVDVFEHQLKGKYCNHTIQNYCCKNSQWSSYLVVYLYLQNATMYMYASTCTCTKNNSKILILLITAKPGSSIASFVFFCSEVFMHSPFWSYAIYSTFVSINFNYMHETMPSNRPITERLLSMYLEQVTWMSENVCLFVPQLWRVLIHLLK